MKVILLVLALIVTAHANEDKTASRCLESLTNAHTQSSMTYQLDGDLIDSDYGRDYLAQAIASVRLFLDDLGCSKKDVNFGKGPLGRSHSRCSLLAPGIESSRACYIESNLGYFLVSWDYQTAINIVFSRWD